MNHRRTRKALRKACTTMHLTAREWRALYRTPGFSLTWCALNVHRYQRRARLRRIRRPVFVDVLTYDTTSGRFLFEREQV